MTMTACVALTWMLAPPLVTTPSVPPFRTIGQVSVAAPKEMLLPPVPISVAPLLIVQAPVASVVADVPVSTTHPVPDTVNPPLDVQKVLPASVSAENYGHYEDSALVALYEKMLHETDPAKQRALMRQLEKYVLDEQAHEIWALWWHRIVPYRSYLKGFKIAPTHFINQDLARLWLDR